MTAAPPPDFESGARGGGLELRVWLRMLTCANLVEARLRRRLRDQFGATLPRFDLMAQLERNPDGLSLGEVARRMMVSNGNVTGLVERLVSEGLVEKVAAPGDRRSTHVRLTDAGRESFAEMAEAHRGWVQDLFGGLEGDALARLYADLGALKESAGRIGE